MRPYGIDSLPDLWIIAAIVPEAMSETNEVEHEILLTISLILALEASLASMIAAGGEKSKKNLLMASYLKVCITIDN